MDQQGALTMLGLFLIIVILAITAHALLLRARRRIKQVHASELAEIMVEHGWTEQEAVHNILQMQLYWGKSIPEAIGMVMGRRTAAKTAS